MRVKWKLKLWIWSHFPGEAFLADFDVYLWHVGADRICASFQVGEQKYLIAFISQWPFALCMPAHISSDSTGAGRKYPSFTVCWLIYTNYGSLCCREDNRIVRNESIKKKKKSIILGDDLNASHWCEKIWNRLAVVRGECHMGTHTHTINTNIQHATTLPLKHHSNYCNQSILTRPVDSW